MRNNEKIFTEIPELASRMLRLYFKDSNWGFVCFCNEGKLDSRPLPVLAGG